MDLRSFLDRMREAGELIDIREPVSLEYKAGANCRQLSDAKGPAPVLHKVGDAKVPLVVNVYGTRPCVALALGTAEEKLLGRVAQRLKCRIPTVPFGAIGHAAKKWC
jgi:UbiD family decarboxylase